MSNTYLLINILKNSVICICLKILKILYYFCDPTIDFPQEIDCYKQKTLKRERKKIKIKYRVKRKSRDLV